MPKVNRPEGIPQIGAAAETLSAEKVSGIHKGMTYNSWNEFADRFESFQRSNFHPVFVINDCQTEDTNLYCSNVDTGKTKKAYQMFET